MLHSFVDWTDKKQEEGRLPPQSRSIVRCKPFYVPPCPSHPPQSRGPTHHTAGVPPTTQQGSRPPHSRGPTHHTAGVPPTTQQGPHPPHSRGPTHHTAGVPPTKQQGSHPPHSRGPIHHTAGVPPTTQQGSRPPHSRGPAHHTAGVPPTSPVSGELLGASLHNGVSTVDDRGYRDQRALGSWGRGQ